MAESKRTWTDRQVEEILGNLLRIGVILAVVVVLAGGVLYLIRYGATLPDYRVFHGVNVTVDCQMRQLLPPRNGGRRYFRFFLLFTFLLVALKKALGQEKELARQIQ